MKPTSSVISFICEGYNFRKKGSTTFFYNQVALSNNVYSAFSEEEEEDNRDTNNVISDKLPVFFRFMRNIIQVLGYTKCYVIY